MPPQKGKSPSESPRVVIRRVKRKPASSPVVVEKKRAQPPPAKPEPPPEQPRPSAPQSSPKPVVVEKPQSLPPLPEQSITPPLPAVDETARNEARKRRYEEALALLEQIHTQWPESYPKEARAIRPMKTGIHRDVSAALPETPKLRIREALQLWYGRFQVAYLQCVKAGQPRYDLAGQVVGEVTGEDEEQAREQLKAVYARKRAKRQAKEEAINRVGRDLFARWPHVFGGPPAALKPLKRGLEADLAEHLPEAAPAVIAQALAQWERVRAVAYLRAVTGGGARYDLAGQPCGEVTPEEAEAARQQLEALYAEQEAKRQEREQQPPAPPEPETSEEPADP